MRPRYQIIEALSQRQFGMRKYSTPMLLHVEACAATNIAQFTTKFSGLAKKCNATLAPCPYFLEISRSNLSVDPIRHHFVTMLSMLSARPSATFSSSRTAVSRRSTPLPEVSALRRTHTASTSTRQMVRVRSGASDAADVPANVADARAWIARCDIRFRNHKQWGTCKGGHEAQGLEGKLHPAQYQVPC